MSIEALAEQLTEALEVGYRSEMLSKGQSRSIIMRNGVLPEGAPNYSENLGYNLLSHGYGVLSISLKLNGHEQYSGICRKGFELAGNAIEAAILNDDREKSNYAFHILVAACSFHLGRFSARAYSLLSKLSDTPNLSQTEIALRYLILRQMDELAAMSFDWCATGKASDQAIKELLASQLEDEDIQEADDIHIKAIDMALTENFTGAMVTFLLALEVGQDEIYDNAIDQFQRGLEITSDLGMVPQWWSNRLAIELLHELWSSSFHKTLPVSEIGSWNNLRSLFIATLYKRSIAELELWPSQLEAASRTMDEADNLIASLPTSAGKTRIAELAILRCLAGNRRVIFITPLRALSAQTETILRKTFTPLGFKISTLYGSMGSSSYEDDVLRQSHIVVATPEKIDFALRNDHGILDDVGLVVLDEGHMIGLNEREIRYENQIQRLLRREDAHLRRIVCLSAILPSGDEFDDFVNWLRRDQEGDAIVSDWRPTRLRFGEVRWQPSRNRGWLEMEVENERTFVPQYIQTVPPHIGTRVKLFPNNQHELMLATTKRLLADDHSVLIYCPTKASVNGYADRILKANRQGFFEPQLDDEQVIRNALLIGQEWLGEDHPILGCLQLGVVLHHGSLPTPYRKEVERLLRSGSLKVTISSPTLAQGLNLSATSILFHGLHRNGELIKPSEFKNIIGRAGRAFVDVEGLVLYPMFDKVRRRQADWAELLNDTEQLSLESGMLRLVISLILRIRAALGGGNIDHDQYLEYIANMPITWECPVVIGEREKSREEAESDWSRYLVYLDTAILSLVGDNDIAIDELANALDSILASSLWERHSTRWEEGIQAVFRQTLIQRANNIWQQTTASQRKGYYLAGVGLTTGQELDLIAEEANSLLIRVNGAILNKEVDAAIAEFIRLAEILFEIPPFVPKKLPDNWQMLLSMWLRGEKVIPEPDQPAAQMLDFIEDALVYRMPWGMEAIKVRAAANGDTIDGMFTLEDFETSYAVPAIETGTLNVSAALLMQAGFTSRRAAIWAVESTQADFTDGQGLKQWIESDAVWQLASTNVWPTAETNELWHDFVKNELSAANKKWEAQHFNGHATWFDDVVPEANTHIRLKVHEDGRNLLYDSSFKPLGELNERFPIGMSGLLVSKISNNTNQVEFTYYGETLG